MQKISVLPSHIADLIAAGEVVERPGSVIKELMENSIDAGATVLTIEIKNGGMTFMRVTDNGCGMNAADAETAFLRHATSKLKDEHGLEAIKTLGFRGEALAAISSISRIELLTREVGTNEGTRLCLEAGEVKTRSAVGCPEGTTIIVRDLFYNTPARQKFMKSDKAEGSNITATVLRCALSHPEVSVRYIKDGKEEYHTPGDGNLDSCIYTLFGRDFSLGLIKAESSFDSVSVRGYVSAPVNCRGNRSYQFFFVNGRFIKSKTLQAALEQAYKNSLFTGKFPACVLYIDISPASVDVNVHPAKTEVKFLFERQVFDGVYYAALSALSAEKDNAEITLSKSTRTVINRSYTPAPPQQIKKSASPAADFFKSMSADKFRAEISSEKNGGFKTRIPPAKSERKDSFVGVHSDVYVPRQTAIPLSNTPTVSASFSGTYPSSRNESFSEVEKPQKLYESKKPDEAQTFDAPAGKPQSPTPASPTFSEKVSEKTREISDLEGLAEENTPYRIIGEALSTYIITERGDSLYLIDKHAAHERIIFDKLKNSKTEIMSQLLLSPIVCDFGIEDSTFLLNNIELLEQFGFEIADFGNNRIIIHQIPSDIETGDAKAVLEELCEKIRVSHLSPDGVHDEIMHTIACKAAIKAGKRTDIIELRVLADKVMSGDVRYCPHGRPIMMELTKAAIDKNFKRI